MGKYLLERNKKHYYRRRIPQDLKNYFPDIQEIRLQVSQKSKFQAIMSVEVLNSLYEELATMLYLDRNNDKDALVMKYLFKMKDYAKDEAPIITYPMEQFYNEQIALLDSKLESKISKLDLTEKKDLLNNLESLDKIIHIIDPKNNLQHQTQSTYTQQETKKTNISFKKLYEIFLQEKKLESRDSSDDISESTWRDYKAAYNDFIYVVDGAEDKDIADFTREDFRTYLNALHNHIPKSRTKLKQFRGLPFHQLKEVVLLDTEKMAHDTKKKKMSTIKQVFDIAIDPRYAYLDENYAKAFVLTKQKGRKLEDKSKRVPLSDDNLHKLFNSKLYTYKVEHTLRHAAENYWIPLIAILSGMRQNEICQLYIEDIKSEIISTGEEVFYFDLNEDQDKHLKNDNAYRQVPIHPMLIELGLMDYINEVKKTHHRLWPNLELHPVEKRYGTLYSSRFSTFFRGHITTEKNQVFHCLRHNVSTQLLNNAVKYKIPKDLMNRIMGHEPDKDETSQSYFDGYSIESLYEGIKTLDFEQIGWIK